MLKDSVKFWFALGLLTLLAIIFLACGGVREEHSVRAVSNGSAAYFSGANIPLYSNPIPFCCQTELGCTRGNNPACNGNNADMATD